MHISKNPECVDTLRFSMFSFQFSFMFNILRLGLGTTITW